MSIVDEAIYGKNTPSNVLRQSASDSKYDAMRDLSDVVFGIKRPNRPSNPKGAFSPDSFRSSFADGIGSTSYFQLNLTGLPPFMQGKVNTDVLRTLPMHIKKAQLPDMNIQTNAVNFGGAPPIEYPYENSTGDLSIEIVSSSNLWEREFFTAWQNYIIDYGVKGKNPTFTVAYYNDYVTDIELDYYSEEGEKTTVFTFENVWPKTMTAVDLDWATKDVLTFTVELSYSRWSIKESTNRISQTVHEKTSLMGGVIDALKTIGLDKISKSIKLF